jgi:hypothetical protein
MRATPPCWSPKTDGIPRATARRRASTVLPRCSETRVTARRPHAEHGGTRNRSARSTVPRRGCVLRLPCRSVADSFTRAEARQRASSPVPRCSESRDAAHRPRAAPRSCTTRGSTGTRSVRGSAPRRGFALQSPCWSAMESFSRAAARQRASTVVRRFNEPRDTARLPRAEHGGTRNRSARSTVPRRGFALRSPCWSAMESFSRTAARHCASTIVRRFNEPRDTAHRPRAEHGGTRNRSARSTVPRRGCVRRSPCWSAMECFSRAAARQRASTVVHRFNEPRDTAHLPRAEHGGTRNRSARSTVPRRGFALRSPC